MKSQQPQFSGFTLIELLVVIAIIGLLSTLAIVALGSARQKSRDARRLADVKQIQTALEMYSSETGFYPVITSTILLGDATHACLGSNGFNAAGACTNQYIDFPNDPSGGYYTYLGTGTDYLVSAVLEGTVNNLSGAVSAQPNAGINNSYNSNYGLVGWWRFEEATGTIFSDSSGNGNSGFATSSAGITWTNESGCKVGKCLYFDGSNYVNVGQRDSLRVKNAVTMAFWVKPAVDIDSCCRHPLGMDNHSYTTFFGSGNLYHKYQISGVHSQWLVLSPATLNNWVFIVSTYDGQTIRPYVNGEPSGPDEAVSGLIDSSGTSFQIGAPYPGHGLIGYLDEARVYNRALSAAEVKALYNSEK